MHVHAHWVTFTYNIYICDDVSEKTPSVHVHVHASIPYTCMAIRSQGSCGSLIGHGSTTAKCEYAV